MKGGGISFSGYFQIFGFCAFEACVGIFWPSIMKMRSQYIPEEARSTIMNFFRIPLNIFVCVVLYNVSDLIAVVVIPRGLPTHTCLSKKINPKNKKLWGILEWFLLFIETQMFALCFVYNISLVLFPFQVNAFPITIMFGMCSIFLGTAAVLQRRLFVITDGHKSSKFCNCNLFLLCG